jgi:putative ABC transport system permease protein
VGIGAAGVWLMRVAFPLIDFASPAWASFSAVGVAIASGLVFGILPARRAAALDPVNALMQR